MTVLDRFLKYVAIHTSSVEDSDSVPSNAAEFNLANLLKEELLSLKLSNVYLSNKCYLYATLPASEGYENEKTIGLIAHIDTCPDVSGANVKPHIVRYSGEDIEIGNGKKLCKSEFECLENLKGEDLVVTDGTTLLGADDKAGIAEIMSAVEYLTLHPEIKHGEIKIAFTPDEEIEQGADYFDIKGFNADFAYTVDGGQLGEIEYENFNAASVKVEINGVNIHPGSAKNKMLNAVLLANEFINMLPPAETPAHTEKYEGFYHIGSISGNESKCIIDMIVRDHDFNKFEMRKSFIKNIADYLNSKYPPDTFIVGISDSYYNMAEKVRPHFYIIDRAKAAFEKCNTEPKIVAIRGGTDGAKLSFAGLVCPNISTGAYNMHSIYEFIPVSSLEKMTEVIVEIVKA